MIAAKMAERDIKTICDLIYYRLVSPGLHLRSPGWETKKQKTLNK
jgi:hypothetical protein